MDFCGGPLPNQRFPLPHEGKRQWGGDMLDVVQCRDVLLRTCGAFGIGRNDGFGSCPAQKAVSSLSPLPIETSRNGDEAALTLRVKAHKETYIGGVDSRHCAQPRRRG
jgi:hypothetical protein